MKTDNLTRYEFIPDASGPVTIELEENASAEYVVLCDRTGDRRETSFEITVREGAFLKMVFISLEGERLRNSIGVSLCGRGASCELDSLCIVDGMQETDFSVEMTHLVPECRSSQLFKNILCGNGVTRFDGMIKVVPGAQKTEAYQANHNLLLSDGAQAFTQPQLEIYADDVKCSHGATTGRLNPDELFYMRSRGISLENAMFLQLMAFASEILDKVSEPCLREKLRILIENKLRAGR